jgi:hypothetical protein
MDLTPLITGKAPTLRGFTQGLIERFGRDVDERLTR